MSQKPIYQPNREFSREARIKNMCEYQELQDRAVEDYEGFWRDYAQDKITWEQPFTNTLNEENFPFVKWFEEGKLNVATQCIDRHLDSRKNKAAIIFEGDRGDKQVITYLDLYYNVNKFANLLKEDFGVQKGDRVVIYMPMIPEAAYAMLACARIGAIHSIVFGGFSSEALKDRIEDAEAKVVITADGAYRKAKPYMLKPVVDAALEGDTPVEKVLVVERNNEDVTWVAGRDYSYNELIKTKSGECAAEIMDAEDPLFLLYTSGSTGKPKGVQHNSAGYILWAQMTMEWVFDVKENDTYWCTADIGWITGHTYIVYGPLAMGATTVMFEGVITFQMQVALGKWLKNIKLTNSIQHQQLLVFYIKWVKKSQLNMISSSLKVLGTVGEPIDPPAWKWYYEEVGAKLSVLSLILTGKQRLVDILYLHFQVLHQLNLRVQLFHLPGIMAEILDPHYW